jgi:hypothetical protein
VRRDGEQINTYICMYVCMCVCGYKSCSVRERERMTKTEREEVKKRGEEQGVGKDQSHGTS